MAIYIIVKDPFTQKKIVKKCYSAADVKRFSYVLKKKGW